MPLERELERLSERIAQIRAHAHLPEALIDIVARTAMLQLESGPRAELHLGAPAVTVTPEQHAEGEPLVERRAFSFAPEESARLFGKLLAMMKAVGGKPAAAADVVYAELQAGNVSIESACRAVINDEAAWFADWSARLPEAPELMRFLAQASITPSLMAQARMLALEWNKGALLSPDRMWEYGICPICGAPPLIGQLATREGAQMCVCSFCRHSYRVKRMQCPFCLEENPEKLRTFSTREEPAFLVRACDTCSCYLKVVDFRESGRAALPVIEDLASLTMDVLAEKEGFRRPTRSAWGF